MGWFGKSSVDKAIDVVGGVAKTGMGIWDASNFTSQESAAHLLKMLEATKSQATSISRRHLLWFIMMLTGMSFTIAIIYNAMGWTIRLNGMMEIIKAWKIGWAWIAAVSFYYVTQFSGNK